MGLSRNPRGAPAQSDPLDATDDHSMPDRAGDATAPRYGGPSLPHSLPLAVPHGSDRRWSTSREPRYNIQHHNGLQDPALLCIEHHPSTPPLHQYDFNSSNQWQAQRHEVTPGPSYTVAHGQTGFQTPSLRHEPCFSSDPYEFSSTWNGRLSASEFPHHGGYGNQADYRFRLPPNLLFPPERQQPPYISPYLPLPQETVLHSLAQSVERPQMPAVQYWPTNDLDNRQKKPIPAHLQRPASEIIGQHKKPIPIHLQLFSLSPGQAGQATVDSETRRKQEAYAKKGALRRQSGQLNLGKRPSAQKGESISPIATLAKPAKRLRVNSLDIEPAIDHSQYQGYEHPLFPTHYPSQSPVHTQVAVYQAPDWDNLCQPVVLRYEDYNWSVQLFELDDVKSGYDFAQSWLDGVYAKQLDFNTSHKWQTHVSKGFIQDGGRLSILVVHNASNPFSGGADSTTSIGVYGRHWHEHNEIHWITIAPGVRHVMDLCEQHQFIAEKKKWRVDMAKASDKRFHRAYWLAANRLELKNLLNHGSSKDTAHDAVEDDEPITFTEADLGNEWDVRGGESAAAWAEVLRQNEEMPEPPEEGWEYVVTGSSE